MSGDTPTLECAECDASVFASPSGRWSEDMPNQFCPSCGAELTIFVDDGGPGEAVASTRVAYQGSPSELRAEVERLTAALADSEHMKGVYDSDRRAQHGEVKRLDVLLGVEMAVRVKAERERDALAGDVATKSSEQP